MVGVWSEQRLTGRHPEVRRVVLGSVFALIVSVEVDAAPSALHVSFCHPPLLSSPLPARLSLNSHLQDSDGGAAPP